MAAGAKDFVSVSPATVKGDFVPRRAGTVGLCAASTAGIGILNGLVSNSFSTALFNPPTAGDLFAKVLVMLPTLSFLIIELADTLTRLSLLDRLLIPGKGRESRVQTSQRSASSRTLSARAGAREGMRLFTVHSDWDRLMAALFRTDESATSFMALVFFRITWHNGDLSPTVVARCMEIRRAIVPKCSMMSKEPKNRSLASYTIGFGIPAAKLTGLSKNGS